MVHETFNERRILKMVAENPGSELIAHPECEETVLRHASYIGSTQALLKHTQESDKTTFIVATEAGILHTMRKASPDKTFIAAAPEFEEDGDVTCGCSTCPHMKLNTLEKVYLCLRDLSPEVEIAAPLPARIGTHRADAGCSLRLTSCVLAAKAAHAG